LLDGTTDLPPITNGDKTEQNALKTIPGNACTHLKERKDDAREAGKYWIWQNIQFD